MNEKHAISNEDSDLSGMAPKLSKLGRQVPFQPSQDYFDDFASKLHNRIEDVEEIKNIAPTLSNIPKYNPLGVPAEYFEELPTIIQKRVIENKKPYAHFEWLFLLVKPRFAIPMIATIFIAIAGINFMNKNAEVKNMSATEELSLEDQLYYINETEIVEQLTASAPIENETDTGDENSIENYLLDNNIEDSNLNNEL